MDVWYPEEYESCHTYPNDKLLQQERELFDAAMKMLSYLSKR